MHKLQGHEVLIVASTQTFVDNITLDYVDPSNYINSDGIPVHRIPYVGYLPTFIVTKFRIYKGLKEELESFKPDVIFVHGGQFLSLKVVADYVKSNPLTKLYVDGHMDYINSAKSYFSKKILHGLLYRWCIRTAEPYVRKFYGTLPLRVDFFEDVYKTPPSKTTLLCMGADDLCVKKAKETNQRQIIRDSLCIDNDCFVLITGGKIHEGKKGVLNVAEAVLRISKKRPVCLLVFGSIKKGPILDRFNELQDNIHVKYVGWLKGQEIYNYFEASDIVIFPGLHSVLWEQATGQGKPCIFRYIEGQTHIDLGGNCCFIYDESVDSITKVIEGAIDNYDSMKLKAEELGTKVFSYYNIAKRAIEQ